jgi:superfamily II DNA helicase RecQ
MCDNCTVKKKKIKKHDEHKLFQVLSTILEIRNEKNFSFGLSTISLILKGSNSKKIKQWMKDLTFYGSMRSMTIKDITGFVYQAIDMGYLENYDIGDCIHVLKCTGIGSEFGEKYEIEINDMLDKRDNNLNKQCLIYN